MVSSDYHEERLKRHADPIVRKCVSQAFNTGSIGYVIMVGGEALNFHLPEKEKVKTADFDLKFVVMPRFTDTEKELRQANVKRLYLVKDLLTCLNKLKPPKGYKKLYPRLTMLYRGEIRDVRVDGHRVYLINPETGEEKFTVYRFNKVFTIKLMYQPNDRETESEFTLIDLGLFYRLPNDEPYYNFMSNTIYNTMLRSPFWKRVPIPYVVKDKIRYPTLPYILVDNFRMILFANDFLHIYADDEERITFVKGKLAGYRKKLKKILKELTARETVIKSKSRSSSRGRNRIEKIAEQIDQTIKMYEPLAKLNSICYREPGRANYIKEIQDIPKCDRDYQKKLEKFFDEYHQTMIMINDFLMRGYHHRGAVKK